MVEYTQRESSHQILTRNLALIKETDNMNRIKLLRTMHHCQSTFLLYEETYAERHGYSVAICSRNAKFAYARDITENRDAAERFFALICKGGLDPCHLNDVLEDMLPLT